MVYFVYVIKSIEKQFTYVGMTSNIERRLQEHNAGTLKSTKYYAPFVLIYMEEAENSAIARAKEKYLKSGHGRRWIQENYTE